MAAASEGDGLFPRDAGAATLTQGTFLKLALCRLSYPVLVGLGDLAAFYLSLLVAYLVRVRFLELWFPLPFSQTFPDLVTRLWIPGVVIGVFAYEGLYGTREPFWEETQKILKSLIMASLIVFSVVSLGKLSPEISRAVVVGTGLISFVTVPLVRFWWKPFLHRRGIGVKKTVLIGENPSARLAHLGLYRDHYMGIRIIGWLKVPDVSERRYSGREEEDREGEGSLSGLTPPPLDCLGSVDDLSGIVRKEGIRGAVIAVPHLRREEIASLTDKIQRHVLSVYVVPNVAQVNLVNSELLYLFYEEIFLLGIHNNLKSRVNRFLKSLSDSLLALVLCVPLMPLMGVVAILVAATSPGPVVFSQWRIGRTGKPFRIYKFRTMFKDSERHLEALLENDPVLRREFEEKQKILDDPRITPFGRFLRKTSLDELPQLFNVLKGEMSFVGPRPVTREELDFRYREAGEDYCLVKPGITGLWQVSGRSERDYGVRVRLDLWYVRNWSLWLDLVILVRTVGVVIYRRGSV